MADLTTRSFDINRTRELVAEAIRDNKNPATLLMRSYGVNRATARQLVADLAAEDRDRPWQPAEATHPTSGMEDMPLRPGDVLAAGLDDGRCPVGIVTAVNDDMFRLDLYSWRLGTFTAGTMIVRHDQVGEFSPLAVQRGDGVFDMDPLAAFQAAWKDANR
jgi:hypothetical protein